MEASSNWGLTTMSILGIQNFYLNSYKFKYLMLGQFTQNVVENLFSTIRMTNAVLD